jgi:hypothetical protein
MDIDTDPTEQQRGSRGTAIAGKKEIEMGLFPKQTYINWQNIFTKPIHSLGMQVLNEYDLYESYQNAIENVLFSFSKGGVDLPDLTILQRYSSLFLWLKDFTGNEKKGHANYEWFKTKFCLTCPLKQRLSNRGKLYFIRNIQKLHKEDPRRVLLMKDNYDLVVSLFVLWSYYGWLQNIFCYIHNRDQLKKFQNKEFDLSLNDFGSILEDRIEKALRDREDYPETTEILYFLKSLDDASEVQNIKNLKKWKKSLFLNNYLFMNMLNITEETEITLVNNNLRNFKKFTVPYRFWFGKNKNETSLYAKHTTPINWYSTVCIDGNYWKSSKNLFELHLVRDMKIWSNDNLLVIHNSSLIEWDESTISQAPKTSKNRQLIFSDCSCLNTLKFPFISNETKMSYATIPYWPPKLCVHACAKLTDIYNYYWWLCKITRIKEKSNFFFENIPDAVFYLTDPSSETKDVKNNENRAAEIILKTFKFSDFTGKETSLRKVKTAASKKIIALKGGKGQGSNVGLYNWKQPHNGEIDTTGLRIYINTADITSYLAVKAMEFYSGTIGSTGKPLGNREIRPETVISIFFEDFVEQQERLGENSPFNLNPESFELSNIFPMFPYGRMTVFKGAILEYVTDVLKASLTSTNSLNPSIMIDHLHNLMMMTVGNNNENEYLHDFFKTLHSILSWWETCTGTSVIFQTDPRDNNEDVRKDKTDGDSLDGIYPIIPWIDDGGMIFTRNSQRKIVEIKQEDLWNRQCELQLLYKFVPVPFYVAPSYRKSKIQTDITRVLNELLGPHKDAYPFIPTEKDVTLPLIQQYNILNASILQAAIQKGLASSEIMIGRKLCKDVITYYFPILMRREKVHNEERKFEYIFSTEKFYTTYDLKSDIDSNPKLADAEQSRIRDKFLIDHLEKFRYSAVALRQIVRKTILDPFREAFGAKIEEWNKSTSTTKQQPNASSLPISGLQLIVFPKIVIDKRLLDIQKTINSMNREIYHNAERVLIEPTVIEGRRKVGKVTDAEFKDKSFFIDEDIGADLEHEKRENTIRSVLEPEKNEIYEGNSKILIKIPFGGAKFENPPSSDGRNKHVEVSHDPFMYVNFNPTAVEKTKTISYHPNFLKTPESPFFNLHTSGIEAPITLNVGRVTQEIIREEKPFIFKLEISLNTLGCLQIFGLGTFTSMLANYALSPYDTGQRRKITDALGIDDYSLDSSLYEDKKSSSVLSRFDKGTTKEKEDKLLKKLKWGTDEPVISDEEKSRLDRYYKNTYKDILPEAHFFYEEKTTNTTTTSTTNTTTTTTTTSTGTDNTTTTTATTITASTAKYRMVSNDMSDFELLRKDITGNEVNSYVWNSMNWKTLSYHPLITTKDLIGENTTGTIQDMGVFAPGELDKIYMNQEKIEAEKLKKIQMQFSKKEKLKKMTNPLLASWPFFKRYLHTLTSPNIRSDKRKEGVDELKIPPLQVTRARIFPHGYECYYSQESLRNAKAELSSTTSTTMMTAKIKTLSNNVVVYGRKHYSRNRLLNLKHRTDLELGRIYISQEDTWFEDGKNKDHLEVDQKVESMHGYMKNEFAVPNGIKYSVANIGEYKTTLVKKQGTLTLIESLKPTNTTTETNDVWLDEIKAYLPKLNEPEPRIELREQSLIDGAGVGLFALEKFEAGELITFYDGVIVQKDTRIANYPILETHARSQGGQFIIIGNFHRDEDGVISYIFNPSADDMPLKGGGSYANDIWEKDKTSKRCTYCGLFKDKDEFEEEEWNKISPNEAADDNDEAEKEEEEEEEEDDNVNKTIRPRQCYDCEENGKNEPIQSFLKQPLEHNAKFFAIHSSIIDNAIIKAKKDVKDENIKLILDVSRKLTPKMTLVTIRAIKPILPGQEIFVNYGVNYEDTYIPPEEKDRAISEGITVLSELLVEPNETFRYPEVIEEEIISPDEFLEDVVKQDENADEADKDNSYSMESDKEDKEDEEEEKEEEREKREKEGDNNKDINENDEHNMDENNVAENTILDRENHIQMKKIKEERKKQRELNIQRKKDYIKKDNENSKLDSTVLQYEGRFLPYPGLLQELIHYHTKNPTNRLKVPLLLYDNRYHTYDEETSAGRVGKTFSWLPTCFYDFRRNILGWSSPAEQNDFSDRNFNRFEPIHVTGKEDIDPTCSAAESFQAWTKPVFRLGKNPPQKRGEQQVSSSRFVFEEQKEPLDLKYNIHFQEILPNPEAVVSEETSHIDYKGITPFTHISALPVSIPTCYTTFNPYRQKDDSRPILALLKKTKIAREGGFEKANPFLLERYLESESLPVSIDPLDRQPVCIYTSGSQKRTEILSAAEYRLRRMGFSLKQLTTTDADIFAPNYHKVVNIGNLPLSLVSVVTPAYFEPYWKSINTKYNSEDITPWDIQRHGIHNVHKMLVGDRWAIPSGDRSFLLEKLWYKRFDIYADILDPFHPAHRQLDRGFVVVQGESQSFLPPYTNLLFGSNVDQSEYSCRNPSFLHDLMFTQDLPFVDGTNMPNSSNNNKKKNKMLSAPIYDDSVFKFLDSPTLPDLEGDDNENTDRDNTVDFIRNAANTKEPLKYTVYSKLNNAQKMTEVHSTGAVSKIWNTIEKSTQLPNDSELSIKGDLPMSIKSTLRMLENYNFHWISNFLWISLLSIDSYLYNQNQIKTPIRQEIDQLYISSLNFFANYMDIGKMHSSSFFCPKIHSNDDVGDNNKDNNKEGNSNDNKKNKKTPSKRSSSTTRSKNKEVKTAKNLPKSNKIFNRLDYEKLLPTHVVFAGMYNFVDTKDNTTKEEKIKLKTDWESDVLSKKRTTETPFSYIQRTRILNAAADRWKSGDILYKMINSGLNEPNINIDIVGKDDDDFEDDLFGDDDNEQRRQRMKKKPTQPDQTTTEVKTLVARKKKNQQKQSQSHERNYRITELQSWKPPSTFTKEVNQKIELLLSSRNKGRTDGSGAGELVLVNQNWLNTISSLNQLRVVFCFSHRPYEIYESLASLPLSVQSEIMACCRFNFFCYILLQGKEIALYDEKETYFMNRLFTNSRRRSSSSAFQCEYRALIDSIPKFSAYKHIDLGKGILKDSAFHQFIEFMNHDVFIYYIDTVVRSVSKCFYTLPSKKARQEQAINNKREDSVKLSLGTVTFKSSLETYYLDTIHKLQVKQHSFSTPSNTTTSSSSSSMDHYKVHLNPPPAIDNTNINTTNTQSGIGYLTLDQIGAIFQEKLKNPEGYGFIELEEVGVRIDEVWRETFVEMIHMGQDNNEMSEFYLTFGTEYNSAPILNIIRNYESSAQINSSTGNGVDFETLNIKEYLLKLASFSNFEKKLDSMLTTITKDTEPWYKKFKSTYLKNMIVAKGYVIDQTTDQDAEQQDELTEQEDTDNVLMNSITSPRIPSDTSELSRKEQIQFYLSILKLHVIKYINIAARCAKNILKSLKNNTTTTTTTTTQPQNKTELWNQFVNSLFEAVDQNSLETIFTLIYTSKDDKTRLLDNLEDLFGRNTPFCKDIIDIGFRPLFHLLDPKMALWADYFDEILTIHEKIQKTNFVNIARNDNNFLDDCIKGLRDAASQWLIQSDAEKKVDTLLTSWIGNTDVEIEEDNRNPNPWILTLKAEIAITLCLGNPERYTSEGENIFKTYHDGFVKKFKEVYNTSAYSSFFRNTTDSSITLRFLYIFKSLMDYVKKSQTHITNSVVKEIVETQFKTLKNQDVPVDFWNELYTTFSKEVFQININDIDYIPLYQLTNVKNLQIICRKDLATSFNKIIELIDSEGKTRVVKTDIYKRSLSLKIHSDQIRKETMEIDQGEEEEEEEEEDEGSNSTVYGRRLIDTLLQNITRKKFKSIQPTPTNTQYASLSTSTAMEESSNHQRVQQIFFQSPRS